MQTPPMDAAPFCSEATWPLPPLILHPFSDSSGPQKLARSSRAALIIEGLLPRGEVSLEDLGRTLLDGRYCEIRMLCYVGKDLGRWIEQCLEIVERESELKLANVTYQSFADLLISDPPENVREKLGRWGVGDYQAIFSRAIGLHTVFADAPAQEELGPEFIRNYFRYADELFACRMSSVQWARLSSRNFPFELYASGEYSRMLEREWGE